MARPIKPAYLKRPREADVNNQYMSLSDHGFIQPVDPRRRPEMADSRMIEEDHNEIANLPRQFIHRQWTPGKYSPHYWMESEIRPYPDARANEPEDE